MSANSITNMLGKTLTVGQEVTHYDGWKGIVTDINEERGLVYVTPYNIHEDKVRECWKLSYENAVNHGFPEFCRPRDHGLTMGNFLEACD